MSKLHKDSMGDDEIFIQELLKAQGEDVGSSHTDDPKKKPKVMTKADWEKRFEQLLKLELIDVPKDFYYEELLFEEPERLMEVFTQLEEQNLQNVAKTQEIEESLEAMKQREVKTHIEIGGELE